MGTRCEWGCSTPTKLWRVDLVHSAISWHPLSLRFVDIDVSVRNTVMNRHNSLTSFPSTAAAEELQIKSKAPWWVRVGDALQSQPTTAPIWRAG